jgi:nitrate reductase NapE component
MDRPAHRRTSPAAHRDEILSFLVLLFFRLMFLDVGIAL